MQKFKHIFATRSLLYISVFLIPFYFFRFHFGFISTNIFEIAVFAALIAFIFEQPKKVVDPDYFLATGIFVAVLALGILFASDKTHAFGIAKGWFLIPAIFGGLVYKNFDSKNIAKLAVPLIIAIEVVAVWALFQKTGIVHTLFYQKGDSGFDQYILQGRAFGPFESPNYLAMFLVPASFFSLLILELGRSRTERMALALTFVFPLLAIYSSGSRAGAIATIVAAAIYLNYRFINKRWATVERPFRRAIFAAGWIVANIIYLFYALNLVKNPIGGDAVRVEIYKYSIQMLENVKNFVFGIGLGDFQAKLAAMSLPDSFRGVGLGYALHPHNLFLAFWLNLGLLGLAGFLYLITIFFKNCFESKSLFRAALIAAMFAILIQGFFDTTYFKNDLSAIFWLIFAGGLILYREKNEKNV